MGSLLQVIYTLFWTFLVIYISVSAFDFFGLGVDIYGIYILWFAALSILSIFLPQLTGNIFNKVIGKDE
tara:strand:- start:338 stop:544 length:207 start_codon:yes stop_codon:yes gene_type:complete